MSKTWGSYHSIQENAVQSIRTETRREHWIFYLHICYITTLRIFAIKDHICLTAKTNKQKHHQKKKSINSIFKGAISTSSIQHEILHLIFKHPCNVEYLFFGILKETNTTLQLTTKRKDKLIFLIIFSQRKFPLLQYPTPIPSSL